MRRANVYAQRFVLAFFFTQFNNSIMLVSTHFSCIYNNNFHSTDGTVNPSNAPIQRNGNMYTFTG